MDESTCQSSVSSTHIGQVTTACNPLLASTGNSTLVTYNTHIHINGNMVLKKKIMITFKLNHLNSSTLQEHE